MTFWATSSYNCCCVLEWNDDATIDDDDEGKYEGKYEDEEDEDKHEGKEDEEDKDDEQDIVVSIFLHAVINMHLSGKNDWKVLFVLEVFAINNALQSLNNL